jgi:hypothetical protein
MAKSGALRSIRGTLAAVIASEAKQPGRSRSEDRIASSGL